MFLDLNKRFMYITKKASNEKEEGSWWYGCVSGIILLLTIGLIFFFLIFTTRYLTSGFDVRYLNMIGVFLFFIFAIIAVNGKAE